MDFFLGWFADPLYFGQYPNSMTNAVPYLPKFTPYEIFLLKNSHDFFGLNHYTSVYVSTNLHVLPPDIVGWQRDLNVNVSSYRNGVPIGPPADSTWLFVVPAGFRYLLSYIKNRYNNPEIIVTENGVSVPRESSLPLPQALNDTFRISYYQQYLTSLEQAISEDKVNVKGYFAWTLLDNLEWTDGFKKRFGLIYVNFITLVRTPKASYRWYSDYIMSHQFQYPVYEPSKWWFFIFLLFPGIIILLTVSMCIVYEKNRPLEDKPLLENNQ